MQSIKRRVLCVDDHDDTCLLLSVILGQAGHEVIQASGLSEGLRLAKREQFDLYVLDNRFADGTGLDLCRSIREFDAATPIIFFSGLAYDTEGRRCLDAGAQAYLKKPDDLTNLVETAARLISHNGLGDKSRPSAGG